MRTSISQREIKVIPSKNRQALDRKYRRVTYITLEKMKKQQSLSIQLRLRPLNIYWKTTVSTTLILSWSL